MPNKSGKIETRNGKPTNSGVVRKCLEEMVGQPRSVILERVMKEANFANRTLASRSITHWATAFGDSFHFGAEPEKQEQPQATTQEVTSQEVPTEELVPA
jgi:hypothetical protein